MAKGKELTTVLKFIGVQDKSVTKTITSISKGLGRMNSMVNKAIKATALAATAIAGTAAAAATATTKALYDMGEGWKKASDTIRVGTGATGQQLAELNQSMQTLYKQLPQGKDEIASTIADINTLTGASGTALEAYASNALKASHMLGVDVKTIYTEASKAFNAFNIPADQMASKLDHLFKVSQATGVGIDKLAQGAVMGQASFRTLGYSFEQATSLLGQLDKAGVRSETVLAALKKGAVELAQNGAKDLPRAFAAVANEIKNAKTETEAMTIAAEVFGARGGGEIAKALRDGRMSAEAFTKSLVESGESIDVAYQDTANFSERMKPLMHTLEVAVKPLADTVFQQINRFIPIVAGAVDKFVPLIAAKASELAKQVETGMTSAINYVQTIDFGAVLDNITSAAVRVGETFKTIWDNKDTIIEYTKVALGVAAAIKAIYIAEQTFIAISLGVKAVIGAYTTFKGVILAVRGAFLALKGTQAVIAALTAAQWAWNVALNANPLGLIVLAIGAVIGIAWLLYDNWDTVCEWCSKAWDATCKGLSVAWDWCVKAWDATTKWLGGAWDATCNAVSAAWDWVCNGLQAAWDTCKSAWDATINWLQSAWGTACANFPVAFEIFKGYFLPAIDAIKSVWAAVTAAFSGDWDGVCSHLREAWEKFKVFLEPAMQVLGQVWDTVNSAISSAWTTTCNSVQSAWNSCKSAWDTTISWLETRWNSVCATLQGAWDGVKNGLMAAWDGIKASVASSIDWITEKIQSFLGIWDKVKSGVDWVKNKIGLGGGEAAQAAQTQGEVQKMATGGFTRGITIAGEAGTEAVISFDPRYRAANQGYLLTAAEMLGMVAPANNTSNNTTHIELGGVTFSPVIKAPTPESAASILDQLRAAVPDLADLLEEEFAKRAAHRYA